MENMASHTCRGFFGFVMVEVIRRMVVVVGGYSCKTYFLYSLIVIGIVVVVVVLVIPSSSFHEVVFGHFSQFHITITTIFSLTNTQPLTVGIVPIRSE